MLHLKCNGVYRENVLHFKCNRVYKGELNVLHFKCNGVYRENVLHFKCDTFLAIQVNSLLSCRSDFRGGWGVGEGL